jgi:hypothetical protein
MMSLSERCGPNGAAVDMRLTDATDLLRTGGSHPHIDYVRKSHKAIRNHEVWTSLLTYTGSTNRAPSSWISLHSTSFSSDDGTPEM